MAQLADIVKGEYKYVENVPPVLPVNRLRFGLQNSKVKAASSLPNNRIVFHPEKAEVNRKLAELARYIKG